MFDRCKNIFGFNLTTFAMVLMAFFIASSVTTSVQTSNNYNSSEETEWILVGGITSSSVTFRVRTADNESSDVLVVSANEDLSNPIFEQAVLSDTTEESPLVQTLDATGLTSDTLYYYGLTNPESSGVSRRGSFSTPGVEGERFNFRIASAGCAWTGSKSKVFFTISDQNPLLYLHLGDFHYEDINENNTEVRIGAIDKVMGSSNQRELFSSVGLVYMWDDHDWLGDESTSEGVGLEAGLESYRIGFPFYSPLPDTENVAEGEEASPYHAFTIGTVRFIVMDLRSESTLTSIYSDTQKAWLFDELSNAASYDFVILMSTKPWVGEGLEPGGDDSWLAYVDDRAELSDFISTNVGAQDGSQNLLMVSADAHMIAFDDGSNTYYGPNENATLSFPILQTGPMDRLGSVKGGPFTHDCHTTRYERNHHFSVIDFEMPTRDDGEPCMKITSLDESESEIISVELCGKIFGSSENAGDGSCETEPISSGTAAVLGVLGGCLVVMSIVAWWFLGWKKGMAIFWIALVIGFGTLAVGFGIPIARDVPQFDTFEIVLIGMVQMICGLVFVIAWVVMSRRQNKDKEVSNGESEEERNEPANEDSVEAQAY